MFLLKELFFLTIVLVLASSGIFKISSSFIEGSSSQKIESNFPLKNSDDTDTKGLSKKFYHYQDQIINKKIDIDSARAEINLFENEFERDYLLALLSKREGKYSTAFNKFFAHLKKRPVQLNFYEELAYSGKISGNLARLTNWISEQKDTSDNYFLYLSALIKFQQGNLSEAAGKLVNLVKKDFISEEILYHLAYIYRLLGNYEGAYLNLNKAVKLCNTDEPFYSKIINLKGTLHFLSGDYKSAAVAYEYALRSSISNGNRVEEIKAMANLAIIDDNHGDVEKARDIFLKAIKYAQEIGNNELLAFLYSELGVSFTYTDHLIEARENFKRSYKIYERLNNDERLCYLSANIGSLFLQVSNYKSALKSYSDGLNYAGENRLGMILNLTGLGDVYSNESNYSKALMYYNRAKEIADSIKDISSLVKIEEGIGALFYNINRPDKSLEILKTAESRINADEMPYDLIGLVSKIGTILTSMDSLKKAEDYFYKGIKAAERTGDIYNSIVLNTELAHNFYKQNKYKNALKLLLQTQKLASEFKLTQVLALQDLYLGMLYEVENKKNQAREMYRDSFELSKSVQDKNTQIEAGYLLAKSFESEFNYTEAEKWYLTTIDFIEKISFPLSLNQEIQISHFTGLNEIYNSFAEFYLKQGRDKDCFMIIEKSRSRNTKANLQKLKLTSQVQRADDYDYLIDLEWMIESGLYNQAATDSLQQIADSIKNKVIQTSENISGIISPDNSLTLRNLQGVLEEDEYLISVFVTNNSVTLFGLNSENFQSFTIQIGRDSLNSLLEAISPIYKYGLENEEIYINADLFSFNAFAANRLHDLIFKELLSAIPEESTLIVSFPTELVKLPLEFLVTKWTNGESPYHYENKNFLINKYKVIYTPSLSIYKIQKSKFQAGLKQNLLVGDPFVDDELFSLSIRSGLIRDIPYQSGNIRLFPLEYSEEEINSIDEILANNIVLLSEDATEGNFKQNVSQSNIVHISSHSFLLKDQPLILFSAQEEEIDDGFLELGEVVQLNLNSELVVLSSCRSGLGRIEEAEGIIGMQKAFFEAGSRSVLVTLWDVSDKYSYYFMQYFYKHLSEGLSKSDALRTAKLDFIKNYSANPYYWSAFVLSGTPSVIGLESASKNFLIYLIPGLLIITLLVLLLLKLRKSEA